MDSTRTRGRRQLGPRNRRTAARPVLRLHVRAWAAKLFGFALRVTYSPKG